VDGLRFTGGPPPGTGRKGKTASSGTAGGKGRFGIFKHRCLENGLTMCGKTKVEKREQKESSSFRSERVVFGYFTPARTGRGFWEREALGGRGGRRVGPVGGSEELHDEGGRGGGGEGGEGGGGGETG